jgi:hypothetical protein
MSADLLFRRTPIGKSLAAFGRLPGVALEVAPISGAKPFRIDRFLSYRFASSMLIPSDSFSFVFASPGTTSPLNYYVGEGDLIRLIAGDEEIAQGIIDSAEIETDESGERITLVGRDLIGQLEDQNAVTVENVQIFAESVSVKQAMTILLDGTRGASQTLKLQDAPGGNWLLATSPGESKLSALQRFLEPLNCLIWTNYDAIVVGKPNFAQAPSGMLICSKEQRLSNVLSMRTRRAASRIPTSVAVLWTEVQAGEFAIPESQIFENPEPDVQRLKKQGHILQKTVTISHPNGASATSMADVNTLNYFGANNLLSGYAKSVIAKANIDALQVSCVVPGHFSENGTPYVADTVWNVRHERGDVDEKLYCYNVEWILEETRVYSILHFCRLGTIVGDAKTTDSRSVPTAGNPIFTGGIA